MRVLLAPSQPAAIEEIAANRRLTANTYIVCPTRPEDRPEGLRIHKLYVMASALKVEYGWATYRHLKRSLLLGSCNPGVDTEVVLL